MHAMCLRGCNAATHCCAPQEPWPSRHPKSSSRHHLWPRCRPQHLKPLRPRLQRPQPPKLQSPRPARRLRRPSRRWWMDSPSHPAWRRASASKHVSRGACRMLPLLMLLLLPLLMAAHVRARTVGVLCSVSCRVNVAVAAATHAPLICRPYNATACAALPPRSPAQPAGSPKSSGKPNIIVILTDDQVSCTGPAAAGRASALQAWSMVALACISRQEHAAPPSPQAACSTCTLTARCHRRA